MSVRRWILSALLLYHVTAVVVHAIPSPDDLLPVDPVIRHPAGDTVSAQLTPWFDRFALAISRLEPVVFAATNPLRQLTRPYIDAGVSQSWTMFTDTDTFDRYVRLDQYVLRAGSSQPIVMQELVFPFGRADRVRILHDFRNKAVVNLLMAFVEDTRKQTSEREQGDDFIPLVRLFTNQFRRRELSAGDRLIRTEVWSGSAKIPPPGQMVPDAVVRERLAALRKYYDGPVMLSGVPAPRTVGTTERQADITWMLERVNTP